VRICDSPPFLPSVTAAGACAGSSCSGLIASECLRGAMILPVCVAAESSVICVLKKFTSLSFQSQVQLMSRQTDVVTEAHRQQLRLVFDAYDRGDGYLGAAQMSKCFSKFGARMTEAELSDLINECGGQVDFNEFVFLMTRKFSDCNPRSEIESAFRAMDKDGDGVISAADAAASFTEMGQEQLASPEFLKELLREMQVCCFALLFDITLICVWNL